MIKQVVFFVTLFGVGVALAFGMYSIQNGGKKDTVGGDAPQKVATAPAKQQRTAIFVPYWSMENSGDTYDRYFYFGVAPTLTGINTQDEGYEKLADFANAYDVSKSYLTIRMLNVDTNASILNNAKAQSVIISEAVKLAQINGFAGIALDLEYSALFDGALPGKIVTFSHLFAEASHKADLKYSFIVYGDAVYRRRPYDIKELANHSDEIILMTYDLHKSRGEPGPNFPLKGKEQYGYDLTQMISDMKAAVPVEKLTIALGMYGYEWTVDQEKRPIKPAEALSVNEISQSYDEECETLNCIKRRDALSAETEIEYVSPNGDYHIIWHEDEQSVKEKQEFSKSQGIGSFALWANGYF